MKGRISSLFLRAQGHDSREYPPDVQEYIEDERRKLNRRGKAILLIGAVVWFSAHLVQLVSLPPQLGGDASAARIEDLIRSVAEAFWVAGFIILFVEVRNLSARLAELRLGRQNVFGQLFGVATEQDVVREMLGQIIKEDFIYLDHRTRLDFRSFDREKGVVLVEQTISMKVRNVAVTQRQFLGHVVVGSVTVPFDQLGNRKPVERVSVRREHESSPIIDFDSTKPMTGPGVKVKPDANKKMDVLYEVTVSPQETIEVSIALVQMHRVPDSSNCLVRRATLDQTVEVSLPTHDEFPDLVVDMFAAHKSAEDPSRFSVRNVTDHLLQARLSGAVLPFQGILVSWHRRAAPSPQPALVSPSEGQP